MSIKKRQAITVTIDKAGGTVIAVEGCAGRSCEALTADLEKALGTVKTNKRTAEYYEVEKDLKVRQ